MDEEKLLDRVAQILMRAYHEIRLQSESPPPDFTQAIYDRRSPAHDLYTYGPKGNEALENAAKELIAVLDDYPLKSVSDRLVHVVLATKDEKLPISTVNGRIRDRLHQMCGEFSQVGEWEILTAVSAINLQQGPVHLGPCDFHVFTRQELNRWGQRFQTGTYDPPANAPIHIMGGINSDALLTAQPVAVVRVKATDKEHALAGAVIAIEEVFDLWRYGQVAMCGFNWPFPDIGTNANQTWQQDFYIQVDKDRNCGTAARIPSTVSQPLALVSLSPGWKELCAIVAKPRTSRTEMERRLLTALTWCGNAAMSRADSVRMVSLATALEAILLLKGEAKGKKAKLVGRVTELLGSEMGNKVATVYGIRSECVHNGLNLIEESAMRDACKLVGDCIGKLTGDARFAGLNTLDQILSVIDPPKTQLAAIDDIERSLAQMARKHGLPLLTNAWTALNASWQSQDAEPNASLVAEPSDD